MAETTGDADAALKHRFQAAWAALGGRDADAVFQQVRARYAQGRVYHDFAHIRAMFAMADRYLGPDALTAEQIVAILFHDAVYEPGRPDNEAHSAELAESLMTGATAVSRERVRRCIMATDKHVSDDPEAQVIIDLDLSFLGAEPDVFDRNLQKLVAEFGHLPAAQFLRNQARYLKPFLDRPHIYYTAPFRLAFEAIARANLQRTIERHDSP